MDFTSQATNPQDVKVTLLLTGGHQYTLYLKPNDPLLHSLMATIITRAQKQETVSSYLFQVSIEGGRATLSFPSEHLIGLVTEPPVYWQQNEPTQPQIPAILESEYVQIDNFLTVEEYQQLLNYVFQRKSAFVPTSTSTGDLDYRRSMILHSFPEFSQLVVNRIQAILPDVFRKLNLSSFPIAEIEAQLTSHNDGNYYKVHNDNGSPDTATREFTYVYYFYQQPKAFSGGELLIYDSKIENNFYVKADSYKRVEPRNNSIVFFLSRYLHEVLPVSCPSKAFADSRFTINGWVRRQV
ncbi:2OG-Fe(II) oxygenase [Allocoleopsis franciscana]|uniref:Putative proline hydroxylase n=1 Tax=Allocoleopsis franciscana PCC 7113 TaxID=1173027 RepID=K9WN66_9CYAN|nr:2OG-Fe(II) oxygenase [Allocoleopsis franciscana]AFZ21209.1 putative proline hydroxylase [Allocoleopsis franciscana PCC 7113]